MSEITIGKAVYLGPTAVDPRDAEIERLKRCVEIAEATCERNRAEIERLRHEWQQAKDAVQHLQVGRPLGELIGKQTIINQQMEIARLLTQIERIKRLDAMEIAALADEIADSAAMVKTEGK